MSEATSFPLVEGVKIVLLTIMLFGGFATWLYRDASWGDIIWKVVKIGTLSAVVCLGLQSGAIWLDGYLGEAARSGSGIAAYFFFFIHPVAQGYKSILGVVPGIDQTTSFATMVMTFVFSVGIIEELTKLLFAVYLMGGKREGYLQIAAATMLSGLAFGSAEAFLYFYRGQDERWSSQQIWMRGCALPLLHASWVFFNGMLCLTQGNPFIRAFRKGGPLGIVTIAILLLPGATLHGVYDATIVYDSLHPGGVFGIIRWILIVTPICAMFVVATSIKLKIRMRSA